MNYPKVSYRTMDAACHVYEVRIQDAPRAPYRLMGTVQRFGALPSMQQWRGRPHLDGATYGPNRSTRAAAADDLKKEMMQR